MKLFFMYFLGCYFFWKPKAFIYLITLWVVLCFTHDYLLHIHWQGIGSENKIITLYFSTLIFEFFLGCVVAIIISNYPHFKYGYGVLLFGIVFYTMTASFGIYGKNWHHELSYGLSAALIVYGAALNKRRISNVFIFLGDASYSIYLFHIFLIPFLINIILLLNLNDYCNNFLGSTVLFVVTTTLCCLIYFFIERPLLFYAKKIGVSSCPVPAAASLSPT